jgi:hypothetical protein
LPGAAISRCTDIGQLAPQAWAGAAALPAKQSGLFLCAKTGMGAGKSPYPKKEVIIGYAAKF